MLSPGTVGTSWGLILRGPVGISGKFVGYQAVCLTVITSSRYSVRLVE
jgi:hypothetical protein